MPATKPTTLGELFAFYHSYVKPLYSSIQVENKLPAEVLFELNATLDHISRHYIYGEAEAAAVDKGYSHLKRACLDVFKLSVKRATDQYNQLKELDTSIIDNGDFDTKLNTLYASIRRDATQARVKEGDTRDDSQAITAFGLWEPVYLLCVTLQTDFFEHPKVQWGHKTAVKREAKRARKERWWGLAIGIAGGFLTWFLCGFLPDPPKLAHHFWPGSPTAAAVPATAPSSQVATQP